MKTIVKIIILAIIATSVGFYGGFRFGRDTAKSNTTVVKEVLVMDELQKCQSQGGSLRMYEALWKEDGYRIKCEIEAKTIFDSTYQPK